MNQGLLLRDCPINQPWFNFVSTFFQTNITEFKFYAQDKLMPLDSIQLSLYMYSHKEKKKKLREDVSRQ